jgi:ubiquinone/menaquinone biosynthesis C-methylase UbiE
MTFVEGFGEELPYKNEVFDTCIIAAALDHCIDPGRVLAEAYRCLKTAGGTILVLQSCRTSRSKGHRPHILMRLWKLLRDPARLLREIYIRLFYQDRHLHHFYPSDITLWLEQAGFLQIQTSNVTGTSSVYAFEAKK